MKVLLVLHRCGLSRTDARSRASYIGVLLLMTLAACHATTTRHLAGVPVPPVESVALRVALSSEDAQTLARTVLFNAGIQVTATNRREGWIRSSLGGMWEDRYRYKQWHLVLTFRTDNVTHGTLVILRAIQQATSYPAGVTQTTAAVLASSGFTQTATVSDVARGDARAAWLTLERVALALTDHGAELLTELNSNRGN